MNLLKMKKVDGVALILTLLLMNLLLILSMYFLSFTLTEKKISKSQSEGAKTYYLAEAGIAEMIIKLKNDATYQTNFETNPTWTAEFTRDNPFGVNSGSYTVSIINSGLADGEIISTGKVDIGGGKETQRIIKISVYKAISPGGIDISDSAIFTDRDISITGSRVNILADGLGSASMHANDDVSVTLFSTVNVDDDIRAVDDYSESLVSTVNVGGDIYDSGHASPPSIFNMPPVDFDSSDSNSFKNRAGVIYTEAQFATLLSNAGSALTLNDPITYVTGDITIGGEPNLTVNGILIADGTIIFGQNSWFWFIPYCPDSKDADLIVNHTDGQPSGIISKENIEVKLCTDQLSIDGIMYAADTISIFDYSSDSSLGGTIIARNFDIFSIWQTMDFTFKENILSDTLAETSFSPVVTIEHWEEEY